MRSRKPDQLHGGAHLFRGLLGEWRDLVEARSAATSGIIPIPVGIAITPSPAESDDTKIQTSSMRYSSAAGAARPLP
jgi:hypothetical protein